MVNSSVKTVYKVVEPFEDDSPGGSSTMAQGDLRKEYCPGIATFPDVGHLLVFDTLDHAKGYAVINDQIWEASAQVLDHHLGSVLIRDITWPNVEEFWGCVVNFKACSFHTCTGPPPVGTLAAEWVKLNKRAV